MGVAMPKFLDVKLYLLYNTGVTWTLATPPFRKNFSEVMSRLSLGTCLPNMKSVALNVLVLDSGYQLQHKIDGPKFVDPSIAAVSP